MFCITIKIGTCSQYRFDGPFAVLCHYVGSEGPWTPIWGIDTCYVPLASDGRTTEAGSALECKVCSDSDMTVATHGDDRLTFGADGCTGAFIPTENVQVDG